MAAVAQIGGCGKQQVQVGFFRQHEGGSSLRLSVAIQRGGERFARGDEHKCSL